MCPCPILPKAGAASRTASGAGGVAIGTIHSSTVRRRRQSGKGSGANGQRPNRFDARRTTYLNNVAGIFRHSDHISISSIVAKLDGISGLHVDESTERDNIAGYVRRARKEFSNG